MTKTILAAVAALLLTSCAVIPGTESNLADTRKTEPIVFESSQAALPAAKCVMKTVDDNFATMTPFLTDGPAPNTYEVRIRSAAGVASVMDFEPSGAGSKVTARISNHYPFRQSFLTKMTGGC
ncbi:MAG: hypothetical protein JWR21_918 [Herminiimonas sp.]|nr:hypothetical protein [Herminiimonas sp.]